MASHPPVSHSGEDCLPAQVYVTEPQGYQGIVDMSFEGSSLRARHNREPALSEVLKLNKQIYTG
jgi:hypothetical protein